MRTVSMMTATTANGGEKQYKKTRYVNLDGRYFKSCEPRPAGRSKERHKVAETRLLTEHKYGRESSG
jgi:hypothetical protein